MTQRAYGFTLAEVLITLGIIGTVAALTIPSLAKNFQNQGYVTGLQKAFTTTQQAFKMYMADEGISSLSDSNLFDGTTTFATTSRQDLFDTFVKKYFNPVKICRADTSDSSCARQIKWLTKTQESTSFPITIYNFYTKDGMEFGYQLAAACNPDFNRQGSVKALCGTVYVDVNGVTPPNKWGRDHFIFRISYDGSLVPYWSAQHVQFLTTDGSDWREHSDYWEKNSNKCGSRGNPVIPADIQGVGCAARIMEEGWKMTY